MDGREERDGVSRREGNGSPRRRKLVNKSLEELGKGLAEAKVEGQIVGMRARCPTRKILRYLNSIQLRTCLSELPARAIPLDPCF